MAQIKRNRIVVSLTMDPKLSELLEHMAKTIGQPKASIIEKCLSRDLISWYEKNEADSPLFLDYKRETKKREF